MKRIIIKAATVVDALLIADLSRTTFYDTFVDSNTKEDMELFLKEQFSKEELTKEVGAEHNYFFLAYVDNILAGYVRMVETLGHTAFEDNPAIEIARLYAIKEMIGKGVGKALMEHCIAFAKQLNKEFIWLGVWEKNVRAISFYKKFGFEKFGEHPFLLGHDLQTDWEMKLKIKK